MPNCPEHSGSFERILQGITFAGANDMIRLRLRQSLARRFIPLQKSLVPVSGTLSPEQVQSSLDIIFQFLDERPQSVSAKLLLFFLVIDLKSMMKAGRPFRKLSTEQQSALLHSLHNSRLAEIRKGFWGLNTLAKMSVYGQPEIYPYIHYALKEVPE